MKTAISLLALTAFALAPGLARAHCDSLDGPVVKAAQKALETGKVEPALAWVKVAGEPEVRAAFARTMTVRALGVQARELADRYFYETLVRVHRAGEGAPYTGLKPAGSVQDPALVAADRAVETGKLEPVTKLLDERAKTGLAQRFTRLRALKVPASDVARGREWVEAYVDFIHYVAGVYHTAAGAAPSHGEAEQAHAEHAAE